MVWLVTENVKEWPGIDEWFKYDFVHVTGKEKIMNAFLKWYKPPDDAPIPGVTNNPDYHRLASDDEARYALRPGSSPSVTIMSMGCRTRTPGSDEKVGTHPPGMIYAMTFKSGIYLNQDVAALIEYAKTDKFPKSVVESSTYDLIKKMTDKMSKKAILDFGELTILHELIHWRHWILGLEKEVKEGEKDYITSKYGDDEAPSYAFEREAYGAVGSLPFQICNKANTDH